MTICHGCNQPLEPLATTRTYHSGCDPRGRVEMLERAVSAFLADWDNTDRLDLTGHHVMGTVMMGTLDGLRAALAYKPAQMLESKLSRIQDLALEAQDDLERRFLESAMRLLVEIENLARPDNG